MGYYYTNLKGLEKVNGEHSLIMLVYNIKRCFSILGIPELIEKLRNWVSPYKKGPNFSQNWLILSLWELLFFLQPTRRSIKIVSLSRLKFGYMNFYRAFFTIEN